MLTWAMAVVVLGAVMFAGARDAMATTFAPTLSVEVADPTADTPSNYVTQFDVGPGDVNFAAVVAFIPPEWGIVPGDRIPVGTDVGFLDAASTLGLFNSACNQALPVHFDFKNASIDTEDTVSFNDSDETDADTTADYAKDVDGNGLYDAIDKYPDFINRLFPEKLQPIRRSAGITLVAGIPVLLQFLVFPPGTVIDEDLPADAERGFPSVTLLQNAGDPDIVPGPSAITDFCSPLGTVNTTLGVTCDPDAALPEGYTGECLPDYNPEPGTPLYVNPQDGDYEFSTVAFGQRDFDGDSYENGLDTCALVSNVGSPKITFDGDLDGDGLDAKCDPDDTPTGIDSDEDADGYQNRQDNCPLDANGEAEGETNQADEDKDQIGDVCDPEPQTENGELAFADLAGPVTIGGGGDGGAASCAKEGGADGVICWYEGYEPEAQPTGGEDTPPPSGSTEPTSPGASPAVTDPPEDDDGGGSGVIIGVIAAIAAVVILGGGAFMLMRRRNGAA